jgi:hypothetical protein
LRDAIATVERNDLFASPSAATNQTRRYGLLRLRLMPSDAVPPVLPGQ